MDRSSSLASPPPNKCKLDRSNTADSCAASTAGSKVSRKQGTSLFIPIQHQHTRLTSCPSASHQRSVSNSSSSITSISSLSFSSLRKSSQATPLIKSSPTVNVHTTCGRHTDQLLFGGPSLKDLARSIKKKL